MHVQKPEPFSVSSSVKTEVKLSPVSHGAFRRRRANSYKWLFQKRWPNGFQRRRYSSNEYTLGGTQKNMNVLGVFSDFEQHV
jgi:hypothetical protein